MASTPAVAPMDLYLQERWTAVSATEPDTDNCRKLIMAEYLALGAAGRWRYHTAAGQLLQQPRSTPNVRNEAESRCAKLLFQASLIPWIRTSYSNEANFLDTLDDDSLERAIFAVNSSGRVSLPIIDTAELYKDLNLGEILNRLPELAETFVFLRDPAELQSSIQERLGYVAEQLDAVEQENEGEDEADTELERDEVLLSAHEVFVTGCFWVQDQHADQHHQMLLVWVDQYGRAIRTSRVDDPTEFSALLNDGQFTACPWWQSAEVTDLYNPLPDAEVDLLNAM